MEWLLAIVLLSIVLFAGIVFLGAPYLPTLSPQIDVALDLLELKKGQTLLELGCGDGRVLMAAAKRGYKVVGIELNPFLFIVSWLRTRKYGGRAKVILGNYWLVKWPPSDGVYVFLIDSFMAKLDQRMQKHGGRLASVAFRVPTKTELQYRSGVFLYDYSR